MNASPEEAEAHAKVSVKENRVYVGNLAYPTTYKDLEKFCQQGGWIWGLGCGEEKGGNGEESRIGVGGNPWTGRAGEGQARALAWKKAMGQWCRRAVSKACSRPIGLLLSTDRPFCGRLIRERAKCDSR